MKRGDFTNLADDYSRYRPSYNKHVVNVILGSTNKSLKNIKAADVGAGTGIFTKRLLDAGVKNVSAIEPNDEMRKNGEHLLGGSINFLSGSAEKTGLKSKEFDLVTMASSFHWPQTKKALEEFNRILSPKGVFSAIWNPRLTDRSLIESEIQNLLAKKYNVLSRVSSGLSGITLELREILANCEAFQSVIYVDAVDVVRRTHEEYLGAWRSVNDIQSQLGKEKFAQFIMDVNEIICEQEYVEVHYLTRAWIACK